MVNFYLFKDDDVKIKLLLNNTKKKLEQQNFYYRLNKKATITSEYLTIQGLKLMRFSKSSMYFARN